MKNVITWLLEPLRYNSSPEEGEDTLYDRETMGDFVPVNSEPITTDTETKLFRPQSFIEYCGQTKAKAILEKYVEVSKTKNTSIPHTLIHGNAGCGKTTLARLLAKERGCKFTELVASAIGSPYELVEIIKQNSGGIIFIDECHGLARRTAEWLYTIMEDFTFGGEKIPAFTLIGATTEYGEMLRNKKPFCDRFKLIIELENYTTTEMEDIISQYWTNVFPDIKVDFNTVSILAKNSRLTPRIGIRLLDATIYFDGAYDTVLNNYNIIKEGFTVKDLKVLNYLKVNNQAGLDSICGYLNTSRNNYVYEIEPYLLQMGVIIRTSTGRRITDVGIQFLAKI